MTTVAPSRLTLAAEGPEQLDDLLRVTPRLAGTGTEAEFVQGIAHFGVGKPCSRNSFAFASTSA